MGVKKRSFKTRIKNDLKYKSKKISFLNRIDFFYISIFLFFLIVIGTICFGSIKVFERIGFFDQPVLQNLSDERILTNIRDNINNKPLLDAVMHKPDGNVYISKQDGTIHKYHPPTHIWSTEKPFSSDQIKNRNFIMLRSGCGTDPVSYNLDKCPDPDSLWALSKNGALIRYKNKWELIVSDTSFIGITGKPVEHSELTSAAISNNNQWLALGTKQNGLGFYNINKRLWISHNIYLNNISHIVWWENAFWVGGPNYLISYQIDGSILKQIEKIDIQGRILDMEIDSDNALWILTQHKCTNGTKGCLWLAKISNKYNSPESLIDEINLYPKLSLDDFNFAQQLNNRLTIAGEAGIYSYDTQFHSWNINFNKKILTTLPFRNNQGFYFGFNNGIGIMQDTIQVNNVPNECFIKLKNGQSNEILGLTKAGNIYSYMGNKPIIVFKGSRTKLDPDLFNNAIALDNSIFFTSPAGALLHNMETRHYKDIPYNLLPPWLTSKDTSLISSANHLYALSSGSSKTTIFTLPLIKLKQSDFKLDQNPVNIPSPIHKLRDLDGTGIGIIANDKRIYHFFPGGFKTLTGDSVPEMDSLKFFDVTSLRNDLFISSKRGIRLYSSQNRSWLNFQNVPIDSKAVEIDIFKNQLIYRTDKNRLAKFNNNNQLLIGDHSGFSISDKDISDVFISNNYLFLAGKGNVELYDMSLRHIPKRWNITGKSDVKIKDIINDTPLTLINKKIFYGEKSIDNNAVQVDNISTDNNFIYSVQKNEKKYLKLYNKNDPTNTNKAICFFRWPSIGNKNTRVLDVKELPDGKIAVLTTTGLYFYNQKIRSWYNSNGIANFFNKGSRLYLPEDNLVIFEKLNSLNKLSFIPVQTINTPHSCSTNSINAKPKNIYKVKALAVSSDSKLTWIDSNDNIVEWESEKNIKKILLSPKTGPEYSQIRRVFDRTKENPGYLLFTTDSEIYKYNLTTRNWTKIELDFLNFVEAGDINIEKQSGQETVVVSNEQKHFYIGSFEPNDTKVRMNKLYSPDHIFFNAGPNDLLDIQDRGNLLWTFVLKDRIKYFDPQKRKWISEVAFDHDPSISYEKAADCDIIVANKGKTWMIGTDSKSKPLKFVSYNINHNETTAISSDKSIWRLTSGHVLLKCTPGYNEYNCKQYGPSPFIINPKLVNQAFVWNNLVIFEIYNNGLRIFDSYSKKEFHIPHNTKDFSEITARKFKNYLLIKSTDSFMILKSNEFEVNSKEKENTDIAFFSNVVPDIVLDHFDELWVKYNRNWKKWNGNNFKNLKTRVNKKNIDKSIDIFALDGAIITGIDQDKYPYFYQQDLFIRDDLPLPEKIDINKIKILLRGNSNDWWVINEESIFHIKTETCHDKTGNENISDYCFVISETFILPEPRSYFINSKIMQIKREINKFNIMLSNGDCIIIQKKLGKYEVNTLEDETVKYKGMLDNQWKTIKDNIYSLKDGTKAYDPIISLKVDQNNNNLLAHRKNGEQMLSTNGALNTKLPSALDSKWLKWNRKDKGFVVKTSSSNSSFFEKYEFIVDKKLIFEEIDAILAKGKSQIKMANRYGIWEHTKSNLELDDKDILFSPKKVTLPVYALHGEFIEKKDMNKWNHISFDDVKISEQIWNARIKASYSLNGISVNAFVGNKFIWDKNRKGLAYSDDGILLLQSMAGINSVNNFKNFDHGPDKFYLNQGMLISEPAKGLFFNYNDKWFKRENYKWISGVKNPSKDRVFINNHKWNWELKNGKFIVNLNTNPYNFKINNNNLGFNSDNLIDATVSNRKLFILTDAFFEIAKKINNITMFNALKQKPFSTDKLDNIRFSNGTYSMFHKKSQAVYRWDNSQNRFLPVTKDKNPYIKHISGETRLLRFTAYPNHIKKELRLENPFNNGYTWVSFNFLNNQFPFDNILSMAISQNEMFIGSSAGLQVYSGNLVTGLNNIRNFFDLRADIKEKLPVLSEVGFPEIDSDLLIARSKSACIEKYSGQSFRKCQDRTYLNNRLRVKNSLWQWTSNNNNLTGRYKNQNKKFLSEIIDIDDGRFPHDNIKDFTIFNGNAFTIWKSNWITVHSKRSLELDYGIINYDLEDIKPEEFIIVNKDILLINTKIYRGLYFKGNNGRIWNYTGSSWQEIKGKNIIEGLLSHAKNPPVAQYNRFRLLSSINKKKFIFEQRSLDGTWHELPWESGRVNIDHWNEFLYQNGIFWVSSPAGIVPFNRTRNGKVKLDLNSLIIIREPLIKDNIVRISDFDKFKKTIYARCFYDSSKLFTAIFNTTNDTNVFIPYKGEDPFVKKEYIKNNYWQWHMDGYKDGNSGSLYGTYRNEKLRLFGGKFAFDTINSIAHFYTSYVDIGTEVGGWYKVEKNNFHVQNFKRPNVSFDPKKISKVNITFSDNKRKLCLQKGNNFIRLLDTKTYETVRSCPEYLCDDEFWQFMKSKSISIISTKRITGSTERILQKGRFTDDIVTGLPVTGKNNNGIYYLLPTSAGIYHINSINMERIGIYLPPFEGMSSKKSPDVLYISENNTPLYFANKSLYTLSSFQKPYTGLTIPINSNLISIENGQYDYVRFWKETDNKEWALSSNKNQSFEYNIIYVNLNSFAKFNQNKLKWGNPDAWMSLNFHKNNISANLVQSKNSYSINLPPKFQLITPVISNNRLLLFGKNELLELGLEQVMMKTFSK